MCVCVCVCVSIYSLSQLSLYGIYLSIEREGGTGREKEKTYRETEGLRYLLLRYIYIYTIKIIIGKKKSQIIFKGA